jgi:hypothetical protein
MSHHTMVIGTLGTCSSASSMVGFGEYVAAVIIVVPFQSEA